MDFRIKCYLKKEMKRLFKSKEVLAANSGLPSPDAKIIFTKTPFIQYEQLKLDKTFRQYLETIIVSKMSAQTSCIFQSNDNQQKNPRRVWFCYKEFKCNSNSNSKKKKKNNAKDLDIDERITKYKDQLKDEYVYRIPLKYFTDLEK